MLSGNLSKFTHTHTRAHARTHARTHTYTLTETHTKKHTTHMRSHTHTHTQTHTHTHTHARTHTHTHTHTHTRTHTHTHTNTHMQVVCLRFAMQASWPAVRHPVLAAGGRPKQHKQDAHQVGKGSLLVRKNYVTCVLALYAGSKSCRSAPTINEEERGSAWRVLSTLTI